MWLVWVPDCGYSGAAGAGLLPEMRRAREGVIRLELEENEARALAATVRFADECFGALGVRSEHPRGGSPRAIALQKLAHALEVGEGERAQAHYGEMLAEARVFDRHPWDVSPWQHADRLDTAEGEGRR